MLKRKARLVEALGERQRGGGGVSEAWAQGPVSAYAERTAPLLYRKEPRCGTSRSRSTEIGRKDSSHCLWIQGKMRACQLSLILTLQGKLHYYSDAAGDNFDALGGFCSPR